MPQDQKQEYCLFGEDFGEASIIAVVESEKTAIIMSELFPEATWLASGGLSQLTAAKLHSLIPETPNSGNPPPQVVLFPDTDPDGTAYAQWRNVAVEANNLPPFKGGPWRVRISDLLERHATDDQKRRKIDIADFVVESR